MPFLMLLSVYSQRKRQQQELLSLEKELLEPLEIKPCKTASMTSHPTKQHSTSAWTRWKDSMADRMDQMVQKLVCCPSEMPYELDEDDDLDLSLEDAQDVRLLTTIKKQQQRESDALPVKTFTTVKPALSSAIVPLSPVTLQPCASPLACDSLPIIQDDCKHEFSDSDSDSNSDTTDCDDSDSCDSASDPVVDQDPHHAVSQDLSPIPVQDQVTRPVLTQQAAAIKIQHSLRRFLRSRPATPERTDSYAVRFNRVRAALIGVFTMKRLVDRRQNRAALTIQQAWHKHKLRHQEHQRLIRKLELPTIIPAFFHATASNPTTNSRKRRAMEEDEGELADGYDAENDQEDTADEGDGELSALLLPPCEEKNVVVSELRVQSEDLFVMSKPCISAVTPPPCGVVRPHAIRKGQRQHDAAVLIQKCWRREMAKQHVDVLRRCRVYEETSESVMPTIRSQMSVLRQRLNELRSSSWDSDEFDDDWL